VARALRIGLYSQFFGSTVGGGEKYLGVAAEAIRDAWPRHRVEILSVVPADRERYERELNLDLRDIGLVSTVARVSRLHRVAASVLSRAPIYRDLLLSARASGRTRQYDLLLPMVYVHPVFSRASRTVILCQFPYLRGPVAFDAAGLLKRLYRLPYRALRATVLGDEVAEAAAVICQSEYVATYVRRYWEREPAIVYPPIDVPVAEPDSGAKADIVLSVGRFFSQGHTKRHDVMVEAFKRMCDDGLSGWELHLVGSVHREAHNAGYYERIAAMADGYPIHLHGDAPYAVLQDLYRRAAIYWHAAGYGVNAGVDPANLEHFGMTTAEAMACGAVPVVIRAGGQPEVVEQEVSGFHWSDLDELRERTLQLICQPALRERMGRAARERSRVFSREHFKHRMVEELGPVVAELEAAARSGGAPPAQPAG
jgi:glycosyltransferase involved in cell wall biosynthesis